MELSIAHLPTWLLAILVIAAWMTFAGAGVLLVRPLVAKRLGERHHDVVVPLFLTTATMYAVVVAFMVVVVWERYADADASDREEATVLVTMYRETLSMPPPLDAHLRGHLRAYSAAVIDEEWPALAQGGGSQAVQHQLDGLYSDYLTASTLQTSQSVVYQPFLDNLNRLAELRANRLLSSQSSLPGALTFGLITGGVLTVANSALFVMQRRALQVVAATLMGAMIGTLLFVVMELDQPYGGGAALTPTDFQYAQTVFAVVDAAAAGRRD